MTRLLSALALFFIWQSALANQFYINKNEVKIDAQFRGDSIHLYGIKQQDDIIITLKGQKQNYTVQKKEKKFGIWVGGKKVKIEKYYQYYAIFSEKSVNSLKITHLLKDFELGIDNIASKNLSHIVETFDFQNAFLEKKINSKLFSEDYHAKLTTDKNLVYTQIPIPRNIPEGKYIISIYQITNGEVISVHNIPLYIHQTGVLHFIKNTSQNYKGFYLLLTLGSSIGFAFIGFIIFTGQLKVLKKNKFSGLKKLQTKKSVKGKRGRPRKKD